MENGQKEPVFNEGQENGQEKPDINSVTDNVLGRIFQTLDIIDRLHCEGVCRRWNATMWEMGWKFEDYLSNEKLFKGHDEIRRRFANENLVSLFERMGPKLTALQLQSFCHTRVTSEIGRSLHMLQNLMRLNIRDFDLRVAVDALPPSLLDMDTTGPFDARTLSLLPVNCPNLKKIWFHGSCMGELIPMSVLNAYLRNSQSLKKIQIYGRFMAPDTDRSLMGVAQIPGLEDIDLSNCAVDDALIEALVTGCPRLRRLKLGSDIQVTEETLHKLADMENLIDLEHWHLQEFTDDVLRTVARRGRLKQFVANSSHVLTDDAILYLLERCKSLLTLDLSNCSKITEKTAEAVVAEVNRRHGNPPETLPESPTDQGIFLFLYSRIPYPFHIGEFMARNRNPWLSSVWDPKLVYRDFLA